MGSGAGIEADTLSEEADLSDSAEVVRHSREEQDLARTQLREGSGPSAWRAGTETAAAA
jgi:hypothetical protein